MKQKFSMTVSMIIMMISLLISCTKKDVPVPVSQPNTPQQPNPPHQGGGQPQQQPLKIKVQAIIKIGDIVYDQIPASFTLTSYDSSMQPHMLSVSLKPGINEVTIPSNHLRYRLFVKQWNQTDEMTLDRSNIQEDVIYTLGGAREAKKLKYEISAVLVNGLYRADSKTEYQYDVNGKLLQVLLLKKRSNGNIYTALSETLSYQDGKATVITRKDETGAVINTTYISYDQQGKIKSLKQSAPSGEINAAISYTITGAGVETRIKHINSINGVTTDYYMLSDKGNPIKRSYLASNNISEWSDYGYDKNINPYIHMNWPDILMSRSAKNNISWTGKEYFSGNMTLDPVTYNYTYDAEGYPVSLVKEFRSARNGDIVNTTKTTYHY
ncbi:hypothetical protein [Sediminibacterium goheungense]|uniref:Uncharacterized protein n=1 Tax=Sediminibacterium goheungense TaxID=1086393 RepID=A0A4R6IYJ9_9BACT|nr:hypothetical protein [Sediminibacterium goheungense]TDO27036.1 hypothetical protein BC659_2353 [Sediminibacterium goheungense]